MKLPYIGLQLLRLLHQVTVILPCEDMLRFRAINTTLQSITAHGLGVGVLIGFEFGSCHNIIGTKSGGIGRFLAVSLLHLLLFLLALAFLSDYGNECCVDMGGLLVHVQDC